MAKCAACGSTIIFGGVRQGDLRYCNADCHRRGVLLAVAAQIPTEVIERQIGIPHQGPCPKCKGNGPVYVHMSYRVWSALVITSWRSIPQISCRSCGTKTQLGNTLFCLVLGWWGIPWGFILTPVQIGRNIYGIIKGPDPMAPSEGLEKAVRVILAARAVSRQKSQPNPSPA